MSQELIMTAYSKPKRFFEDSGTVDPSVSYHVDLENVTNTRGQDMRTMVDLSRYFSIFAPRQSGKTTFFEGFCMLLAENSTYIPILLSFQYMKNLAPEEFYTQIQKELFHQLMERLESVRCIEKNAVKAILDSTTLSTHLGLYELFTSLNRLIKNKRIVIFIDEFDGIPRSELENFLTTLRELYQKYKKRPDKALYSVGLVGIRNITKLIVGGVSPFNIADQVKLPPFSLKNIQNLYGQYTAETHQSFTTQAIQFVHKETAGQPWLVNRLGTILTVDIKPGTVEPVTEKDVKKAVLGLLRERNNHFDNLLEKARQHRETFVEIVFDGVAYDPDDLDQSWLEQYGLIREKKDKAVVANPIYQKRFTKTFFREAGAAADISLKGYYTPDGFLNMRAILTDFEEYIMRIGVNAFYTPGKPYEKTGQFLLTAWLYQFVEGGRGDLRYEVPSGLGRMDILLTWRGRKYIIETKINRSNMKATLEKAFDQVRGKYLTTEKANEGYLVVFDLRKKVGEVQRPHELKHDGKTVGVFEIAIGKG